MVNIFVIAFLLKIKLHKCKGNENYAPAPPVSHNFLQQNIRFQLLLLNHKKIFGQVSFKPNVTITPYSFIIHMILFIHVYFFIITYKYISSIFSRLVYQRVRMTQFSLIKFNVLQLSFCVNEIQCLRTQFCVNENQCFMTQFLRP